MNDFSTILSKLLVRTVASLLGIFLLLACQQPSEFHLVDGKTKTLDDYRGQWLLINFWAEWCPPCLKEIPELNALAAEEGLAEGLNVIAVSYDKLSNHQLKEQAKKYKINYPMVATDPMPYLPMARPQGLPANYLFTPEGEMIGPLLGKQDKASIMALIQRIKAERAKLEANKP